MDETRCLCSMHDLDSFVADLTRTGKLTVEQTCFESCDAGAIDTAIYMQPARDTMHSNEVSSPFSVILSSLRKLARELHPLKDEPLMSLFE